MKNSKRKRKKEK